MPDKLPAQSSTSPLLVTLLKQKQSFEAFTMSHISRCNAERTTARLLGFQAEVQLLTVHFLHTCTHGIALNLVVCLLCRFIHLLRLQMMRCHARAACYISQLKQKCTSGPCLRDKVPFVETDQTPTGASRTRHGTMVAATLCS